ncbi:TPA: HNH endonuclease [Citrobacter braakii]
MNYCDYFSYENETGILRWKVRISQGVHIGDEAGRSKNNAYAQVRLNGKLTMVHRIIWEMHNGAIDSGMYVDHIDGNTFNNRLSNLRLVTHQDNHRNQKKRSTNKSGYLGVSWNKQHQKWQASIKLSGKVKYLGWFDDIKDAARARKAADIEFGFHENHGR